MFPQSYLSYLDHFRRGPVVPGSFPSSLPSPGEFPMAMPGPGMFPEIMQGGESMQGGGSSMGAGMQGGSAMPGAGGMQGGAMGTPSTTPSPFETAPGSPTILDTDYTQGFLRTQIGKRMRVTFLLGTSTLQDREGILEKVGISYIILREIDTNVSILCDIYSIKFVNIFAK